MGLIVAFGSKPLSFRITFNGAGIVCDCVPFDVPFVFKCSSPTVVLIDDVFVAVVVLVVTEMVPLDVVTVDDVKLLDDTADAGIEADDVIFILSVLGLGDSTGFGLSTFFGLALLVATCKVVLLGFTKSKK